jgi:hypothetical protein
MRRFKFLLASIVGVLAAIAGEAFVRRVMAASLCGTLTLNSSVCVANLARSHDVDTGVARQTIDRGTSTGFDGTHTIAQAENEAKAATLNGDLSKYDTIEKRNKYYEQIHEALQACSGTRGIQFFAAAENVTRFAGVGIVESWWSDHSEATKQVYKDINTALFKENAKIAKSLLEKCQPVQPEHPDKPCFDSHPVRSNFDFDIAMTEFEQNLVQRQFIELYQDNPDYKTVFKEINDDLNFKGVKRTIIAENILAWNLSKAGNWAKEALGVSQLEYKSLNHRLALAQALIHIKHEKTKDDFKSAWRTKNYPDNCSNNPKDPQKSGKSYGDPHIVTIDGFSYSLQTVGEVILVKANDGSFEVQERHSAFNTSMSLNTAVAVKVGRDRVALYTREMPDGDTSTPLRVNGKPVTLQNDRLGLPGGGSIVKQANDYVIHAPSGENVVISPRGSGDQTFLNISPFVYNRSGKYSGLLGNVNGNPKDDLQIRGGASISATRSSYGDVKQALSLVGLRIPGALNQAEKLYFDSMYKKFASSWQVKSDESLFDYPVGKTTQNYTDPAFPDKYLTLNMLSSNQIQQARDTCTKANVTEDLMEGCIFDVGFSGFSEFARATAEISGYIGLVNQLVPAANLPTPEQAINRVIEKVKPKVCLPVVGCL